MRACRVAPVIIRFWLSAILLSGCSNAPPFLAPGFSSQGGGSIFASCNLLSNYGKLELTGEKIERSDGQLVDPEYSNQDYYSQGGLWFYPYVFYSIAMVNFQLQASGGWHWRQRVAIAYFPTLTLAGRHWLNGLQIETRLPLNATVSLSAYEEYLSSIRNSPLFGDFSLAKRHRVAAVVLNLPFAFGKSRVWLRPDYRQSLDYGLRRFGVDIGMSVNRNGGFP